MLHDCAASVRKAREVGAVMLHGSAEPAPAGATGTVLEEQSKRHIVPSVFGSPESSNNFNQNTPANAINPLLNQPSNLI